MLSALQWTPGGPLVELIELVHPRWSRWTSGGHQVKLVDPRWSPGGSLVEQVDHWWTLGGAGGPQVEPW